MLNETLNMLAMILGLWNVDLSSSGLQYLQQKYNYVQSQNHSLFHVFVANKIFGYSPVCASLLSHLLSFFFAVHFYGIFCLQVLIPIESWGYSNFPFLMKDTKISSIKERNLIIIM